MQRAARRERVGVERERRANFVEREQLTLMQVDRDARLRLAREARQVVAPARRERGPRWMTEALFLLLALELFRRHEAAAIADLAAGQVERLDHAVAVEQVLLAKTTALEHA